MIDLKTWQTILDTHKDARYGYVAMTSQTYFSHVGHLLLEIACLQREVRALRAQLATHPAPSPERQLTEEEKPC